MPSLKHAFRRLERLQVFRYGVAAGTAMSLDILIYTILKNYVILRDVHFMGLVGSPHAVSLVVSFGAGLVTNFSITKIYVFRHSQVNPWVQFARFVFVSILVFWANKFAMEGLYMVVPTIIDLKREVLTFVVRTAAALGIGLLSFTSHRLFTFKGRAPIEGAEARAEVLAATPEETQANKL